jgi:hypothetical protein
MSIYIENFKNAVDDVMWYYYRLPENMVDTNINNMMMEANRVLRQVQERVKKLEVKELYEQGK